MINSRPTKQDQVSRQWQQPWFSFRHFQTRLLVLILILVISLQAGVFFIVSSAANRNAIRTTEASLQMTARSLQTILSSRSDNLRKIARLLTSDFAFKSLAGEADSETILSAFQNYQQRANADWMVMLSVDGKIKADTLPSKKGADQTNYAQLIIAAKASKNGESAGIMLNQHQAYQMVLVPLNAPEQVAWIGIGFAINDVLANELEQETLSQVSFIARQAPKLGVKPDAQPARPVQLLATTLVPQMRADFIRNNEQNPDRLYPLHRSYQMTLTGRDYISLTLPLSQIGKVSIHAVLQRSLDEALAGYRALRWQLLTIFLLTSLLAAWVSIGIARRITRPVLRLAYIAGKIREGHYELVGDIQRKDEFGELAQTFDDMVRGLVERDQVRSLLGKVVSPAVAQELLSRRIELGGEEREISILFSDIRSFTSLAEVNSPSATLAILNTYLTEMSALVDQHGGVVDKYIGDAVMGLFGAPIQNDQDPQHAVATALAMIAAMPALNQEFAAQGWPPLEIGIGVHTGNVVAGNVGSNSRLNYTVLGDNVNLASRLESLCKQYQVMIIVSDATMQHCPDIAFRELDRVRVKGKQQAVNIFQAVAYQNQLTPAQHQLLAQQAHALAHYRQAEFAAAKAAFLALPQDNISAMYIERCERFLARPPLPDWDAVETLDKK
jgi:adenylate cyclase